MSDTTPKKKKPMLPNPAPKPGMQLWVLTGLVVFILGMIYLNRSNSLTEIKQRDFEQMLVAGDVSDVALVNDRQVKVTLKREARVQAEAGSSQPAIRSQ
jgi:AFG3 family protein